DLLQRFTYPAFLLLLSAAGLGVPTSEDLLLLIAGALSSQGGTRSVPTLLVGYFGVIFGDGLIYHWGKKLGPAAYEHRLVRKVISRERAGKLHSHFARHGFWTVVVGRHMPGLRAPVFFLAGASGVRFATFLIADMLSAAVTVPAVVTLGYLFGTISEPWESGSRPGGHTGCGATTAEEWGRSRATRFPGGARAPTRRPSSRPICSRSSRLPTRTSPSWATAALRACSCWSRRSRSRRRTDRPRVDQRFAASPSRSSGRDARGVTGW